MIKLIIFLQPIALNAYLELLDKSKAHESFNEIFEKLEEEKNTVDSKKLFILSDVLSNGIQRRYNQEQFAKVEQIINDYIKQHLVVDE